MLIAAMAIGLFDGGMPMNSAVLVPRTSRDVPRPVAVGDDVFEGV